MSRALLNKITLVLAAFGCIVALVLTYEHFRPAANIGCGIVGGNCHKTIESAYGHIGPIPTSILGLGMYLTLVGICILRARSLAGSNAPGPDENKLGMALFAISALAFCTSWWLQYVSFFVILSFCPWCFTSALTVTAIFLINAYDYLIHGRTFTGEQKMLSGVMAFIGVMMVFMYAPQVLGQIKRVLHPPIDPNAHAPQKHPREEILPAGIEVKGKPNAPYTIVEFADYACSHCKEASADMDALLKKFPDRYRLAFRNFPLGRWTHSVDEAAVAEAAGLQGKFWEMHDILFAHQAEVDQPGFDADTILEWARPLHLDMDRLKKDMQSPAIRERVARDHTIGSINRMNLTPTFFIVPSDPSKPVMMIVGGADAHKVLYDPSSPFWNGDQKVLTNPDL